MDYSDWPGDWPEEEELTAEEQLAKDIRIINLTWNEDGNNDEN